MLKWIRGALVAAGLSAGFASSVLAEPALWTLSDEDTTITIMGTVHLLPPETDWRSERIEAAFDAADTVCFELDAVGRALEILGISMRLGLMPKGDRLTNHLTEDEIADLKALAGELGVPFASLDVMQPWFVGLTMEQYMAERAGLEEGVEFTLHPDVLERGKTLCELETVDEQMTALAGQSLEAQFATFREGQEAFEELEPKALLEEASKELDDLIANWLAGDVDGLSEQVNAEAFGSQTYYDALLVTRNTAWVPRIEAMLEGEGNIFIAVGAAHLAGPDSVITMLRNKGYEIKGP